MKTLIPKSWDSVLVMLVCGGLSAWLTLDEKSADAIIRFVGPLIGAGLVIGVFVLLIGGVICYLVALNRRPGS
jgi:hypothetical protein